MTPGAETVRSTLRWAIPIVDAADPGRPPPSTGYSQVSFGRMLTRGDPLTAADIIAQYCPDLDSREGVAEYLSWIRRDQRSGPRRSQSQHPGLRLALTLVERMHAYHTGESRRLLEQGSVMTWKGLEAHWPGRVWHSLRDDYEVRAEKFWRAEQLFICETSEFVVKLDTLRDSARRARGSGRGESLEISREYSR